MKRLGLFVALVLAVTLGVKAAPVFAEAFTSASDKLTTVTKDQIVDGSAYLAGETVTVAGTVKGDVYCAGQDVTISGTVEGDVLCAGQNITIDGTVRGDVRLAGAEVLVKGTIDGSATLAGATITTDASSKIGRDVVATGSQVILSGTVGRDAALGGTEISVGGTIGRDVTSDVTELRVASSAKVGGNLLYSSNNESSVPSGVVAGKITHDATAGGIFSGKKADLNAIILFAFLVVASFILFASLVTLTLPRYIQRVSNGTTLKSFGTFFLVGLATLMVAPFVILLLMVSAVGSYAAIALCVALVLVVMLSGVPVAYSIGRFMLAGRRSGPLLSALLGATVLGVLSVVPFVGVSIALVAILVGVGMVVLGMKDQYTTEPVKVVPEKKPKAKRT